VPVSIRPPCDPDLQLFCVDVHGASVSGVAEQGRAPWWSAKKALARRLHFIWYCIVDNRGALFADPVRSRSRAMCGRAVAPFF